MVDKETLDKLETLQHRKAQADRELLAARMKVEDLHNEMLFAYSNLALKAAMTFLAPSQFTGYEPGAIVLTPDGMMEVKLVPVESPNTAPISVAAPGEPVPTVEVPDPETK